MTDPSQFLESVAGYVAPATSGGRTNRLGTVHATPAAGLVRVKFDGEAQASVGGFAYNAAYTPTIGDRVLCHPAGSTYVVAYKLSI